MESGKIIYGNPLTSSCLKCLKIFTTKRKTKPNPPNNPVRYNHPILQMTEAHGGCGTWGLESGVTPNLICLPTTQGR